MNKSSILPKKQRYKLSAKQVSLMAKRFGNPVLGRFYYLVRSLGYKTWPITGSVFIKAPFLGIQVSVSDSPGYYRVNYPLRTSANLVFLFKANDHLELYLKMRKHKLML